MSEYLNLSGLQIRMVANKPVCNYCAEELDMIGLESLGHLYTSDGPADSKFLCCSAECACEEDKESEINYVWLLYISHDGPPDIVGIYRNRPTHKECNTVYEVNWKLEYEGERSARWVFYNDTLCLERVVLK